MVIGPGVSHTAGRGLVMSLGDGPRITMAVGSITTTIGHGVLGVTTLENAAGGVLRLSHSISLLEVTFPGTHFLIIIAILVHIITAIKTG